MRTSLRRDPGYIAFSAPASRVTRGPSRGAARWGLHFGERADLAAPEARILWSADLDPGTLRVIAEPGTGRDAEDIDPAELAPWLTVVAGPVGRQYAVLSDGWRHIRLDVEGARLISGMRVLLHVMVTGRREAEAKLVPLRRLLHLYRHRGFSKSLYPPDPRIDRWLAALRIHDALTDGASQREIAEVMFPSLFETGWNSRSDFLRSRIRRLVREARRLAGGGFRSLMTRP